MANMNYWERAAAVLEPFLSDYTREELKSVLGTHTIWRNLILKRLHLFTTDGTAFMLELWHGPTCAFKDMALQILPT